MEAENDPIRLHKQGNTLYETAKYEEAADMYIRSAELYEKKGNFFDASNMLFKAGECSFMLKEYEEALERFKKSADVAFRKGFDRFGVSALEYAVDCYKALKKDKGKEITELSKKIKEIKDKLATQLF